MAKRKPGWLKAEAKALYEIHGVDIRDLPRRALRLMSRDNMEFAELAYVAEEIAKLKRHSVH